MILRSKQNSSFYNPQRLKACCIFKWKLGHGYLIYCYIFPPIGAKWARPKFKNTIFILFFLASRLCNISGTTWPREVVHLSKFAGFCKEINGNIYQSFYLWLMFVYTELLIYKFVWAYIWTVQFNCIGLIFYLVRPTQTFEHPTQKIKCSIEFIFLFYRPPDSSKMARGWLE